MTTLLYSLLLGVPFVIAQSSCISLRSSTTCPAFNQSSISTSPALQGRYPFLRFVSDVSEFDAQFSQYISTTYTAQKYQQILGCTAINLTDTSTLYARYTRTVLCNAIVQQSLDDCQGSSARPVCAESCVSWPPATAFRCRYGYLPPVGELRQQRRIHICLRHVPVDGAQCARSDPSRLYHMCPPSRRLVRRLHSWLSE